MNESSNQQRPTQRAPDVWDSAAFSSIFLASSFSCSQALFTPAHTQVTQAVGRFLANGVNQMSMAYIREFYKVPAKRGGRVLINGWAGKIVGSDGQYLKVLLDGSRVARLYHPTWRVTYYTTPNKACTRRGAAGASESKNTVAPRG